MGRMCDRVYEDYGNVRHGIGRLEGLVTGYMKMGRMCDKVCEDGKDV